MGSRRVLPLGLPPHHSAVARPPFDDGTPSGRNRRQAADAEERPRLLSGLGAPRRTPQRGRRGHPCGLRRHRDPRLPRRPGVRHPAPLALPRRPARPPGPAGLRPRSAVGGGVRVRGGALDGPPLLRAARRARAAGADDDHRLPRTACHRPAGPPRRLRHRAVLRARGRRSAGRPPPRPAHHRAAQGQPARPALPGHPAQRLRPDRRRPVRGARPPRSPRRHAHRRGGAGRPRAEGRPLDAADRRRAAGGRPLGPYGHQGPFPARPRERLRRLAEGEG
ncbi:hypothetical protein SAMN04490356_3518 [Streptomyces melanosporofaciens]|uniref:Uncharacterized protein n=1 Tax=Streptomyces melanosporofaciens TaxID=67327 RepID=A0A1H4R5G2_STRMJ|nr:hypothetical protein SAMN04490356_3518 [Streptomyces melanosporofaciens]